MLSRKYKESRTLTRLGLHRAKYVFGQLLHEASGLSYVREILITVGQNHLAMLNILTDVKFLSGSKGLMG